ncbi:hypothetical protein D5272_17315, partial [bacterium D16-76]|nr:hypothetical protein [bacterium D16-76]
FRKVFRRLFEEVVRQCVEKGLVSSRLVVTDSTHMADLGTLSQTLLRGSGARLVSSAGSVGSQLVNVLRSNTFCHMADAHPQEPARGAITLPAKPCGNVQITEFINNPQ